VAVSAQQAVAVTAKKRKHQLTGDRQHAAVKYTFLVTPRTTEKGHDRFTHSCIEVFDHHCPFVGASIGLYNYRYFFLFCVSMTFYFIGFWIVLSVFFSRVRNMTTPPPGSWIAIFLGVFLGVHTTIPAGMALYHAQLI